MFSPDSSISDLSLKQHDFKLHTNGNFFINFSKNSSINSLWRPPMLGNNTIFILPDSVFAIAILLFQITRKKAKFVQRELSIIQKQENDILFEKKNCNCVFKNINKKGTPEVFLILYRLSVHSFIQIFFY